MSTETNPQGTRQWLTLRTNTNSAICNGEAIKGSLIAHHIHVQIIEVLIRKENIIIFKDADEILNAIDNLADLIFINDQNQLFHSLTTLNERDYE